MTTLAIVGGMVILCGLAIWWGRRDARKLGEAESTRRGLEKVVENVEEAERARRDPDAYDVRRFDRED